MKALLTLSFLFISITLLAQTTPNLQKRRIMNASRTSIAPKIDGFVTDAVWLDAEVQSDFTQLNPNPLEPSQYKTEVRILYDDAAVYVAFMCFDESITALRMFIV